LSSAAEDMEELLLHEVIKTEQAIIKKIMANMVHKNCFEPLVKYTTLNVDG